MMKKTVVLIPLCILLFTAVWAFAAGGAEDPLATLSYLTETFSELVDTRVNKVLKASDAQLLENADEGTLSSSVPWTETRVKSYDMLFGSTGSSLLPLAGSLQVTYPSGAVVDVTVGEVIPSGSTLISNHRYLVAEDTLATFTVLSKTAVVDYEGTWSFSYADSTDYNTMAAALKSLNLFKGSFTGYGEGYDLEVAPTRLQALIMFIRVLGEEEQALAWSGTQPFKDIHPGTQAFQYVGYAYEMGYTNGYTPTEFRPAGSVNAYQYTEFVLRAMGYSSAANTNLADTLLRAQDAGLLTAGEADALQHDTFLRADLVYISYYALDTDLPDSRDTLADLLMDKGIFDRPAWRDARNMVTSSRL